MSFQTQSKIGVYNNGNPFLMMNKMNKELESLSQEDINETVKQFISKGSLQIREKIFHDVLEKLSPIVQNYILNVQKLKDMSINLQTKLKNEFDENFENVSNTYINLSLISNKLKDSLKNKKNKNKRNSTNFSHTEILELIEKLELIFSKYGEENFTQVKCFNILENIKSSISQKINELITEDNSELMKNSECKNKLIDLLITSFKKLEIIKNQTLIKNNSNSFISENKNFNLAKIENIGTSQQNPYENDFEEMPFYGKNFMNLIY